MTPELIWQHIDSPGWEHVRVMSDHPGWTVFDSILVREHNGQALRGGYTLVTDKEWRTLELRLMIEAAPGSMEGLHLLTQGDGKWTDANEQHFPELDGILDIEIAWSPLTNSLPINRLQMKVGDEHAVPVARISLPELTIQTSRVLYRRTDESHVQYSPDTGTGDAVIAVDSEGLVVETPGSFRRTSAF